MQTMVRLISFSLSRISCCVGGLWSTKKETDDKLIEMQTKLRELIVYLMFLGIVTTGVVLYIIIKMKKSFH